MDLICFSHLRWDFVFQRPQHLLTRFADHFRIFFIEEPFFCAEDDRCSVSKADNVYVVKTYLKSKNYDEHSVAVHQKLLYNFFTSHKINEYIFWYYTPMALNISSGFSPLAVIYDCMDELSAFKFAPPSLKELEKELMRRADIVFTGGNSLYKAKKHQHSNIFSFPSSIDKKHFLQARKVKSDPADQEKIPHPRFGFYGVIDERFDIDLIREVAEKRPDWQIVLLGPVVKIDPATLPKNKNIHYLGGKSYAELPAYLGGWDIAMVCFAMNESTKFISPTKTPEYLAGGKPVISTPITDVVYPYGVSGLVHIAAESDEFISCAEKELNNANRTKWLKEVDMFLADNSWDKTVLQMRELIYSCISTNLKSRERKQKETFAVSYLLGPESLTAAS